MSLRGSRCSTLGGSRSELAHVKKYLRKMGCHEKTGIYTRRSCSVTVERTRDISAGMVAFVYKQHDKQASTRLRRKESFRLLKEQTRRTTRRIGILHERVTDLPV
eukprot:scaffold94260_cov82-Phaeocystis_antarctica.AAC.4